MGLSRQEYWSGLLFPSPGEYSRPRDQTRVSCVSCITGRLFTTSPLEMNQLPKNQSSWLEVVCLWDIKVPVCPQSLGGEEMVGLFPVSVVSMNHSACSEHMKHLFSLLDVTDAAGYYGKCVCVCVCVCVYTQVCLTLCNTMDCNPQAPLSMGFPRLEYRSGLPFPSPGNLPDLGIKPLSPSAGRVFTTSTIWEAP